VGGGGAIGGGEREGVVPLGARARRAGDRRRTAPVVRERDPGGEVPGRLGDRRRVRGRHRDGARHAHGQRARRRARERRRFRRRGARHRALEGLVGGGGAVGGGERE